MLSIEGIGVISTFGQGMDALTKGITGHAKPEIRMETIPGAEGPVTVPAFGAKAEGLDQFAPPRLLRRLDHITRMAALASFLALEDSHAAAPVPERERLGLVFATAHGPTRSTFAFHDRLMDDGDACPSPTLFAGSVHNTVASQVSILLDQTGPAQTIACFEGGISNAFLMAYMMIQEGAADTVLVGCGEELCPALIYGAYSGRSEVNRGPDPMAFDECRYCPGEGFVVCHVTSAPMTARYGAIVDISSDRAESEALISRYEKCETLILAANGDRAVGPYYQAAARQYPDSQTYSQYYGSMATGQGFDVAIIAASGTRERSGGNPCGSLAFDRNGMGHLIRLAR